MSLISLFKKYKDNEDGNFSVFFAAGFLATFMIIATSMDLMLIHRTQSKLQYLADASALHAVKSFSGVEDKEQYYKDYVDLLYSNSKKGTEGAIIRTDVTIEETDRLVKLNATVTAPVKLTLLQNTFKYDSVTVRTEAESGIENVEVALVLDISSSMKGARITEAKKAAKAFVEQTLGDENLVQRVSVSLIPFGGTVRVPEGLIGLLNLPEEGAAIDAFSQHWIDGQWNQCFEYTTDEVEAGIQRDQQYEATEDYWSWNYTNPWCPTEGNEFVPLSNDSDVLNTTIDNLTLSDGTGTDHGMLWGVESLDNDWINALPGGQENTPAAFNDRTKKVIILMSDGGITAQHYVRDEDMVGSLPYNSKRKVQQNYTRNKALSAYYSKCDEAKDAGIEVYTIGFLLKKAREATELANCATSLSHFFEAGTGDLESIFVGLANSISPVRLSN